VLNSADHRCVAQNLLAGQVHEQRTIDCILKYREEGAVIHAGAFIGDMIPALSGRNTLYAFEPGKEFFRCCKITLDLNFADDEHNTILFNMGLGAEPRIDAPLLTKENEERSEGGASRIMQNPDGVEPYRMESVEITTIDNALPLCLERTLIYNPITVIHLDVEGYEEEALKGGIENIRHYKPVLIVEIGLDDTRIETDFYRDIIFGELGYKEIDRFHGNRVYKI
jgi:FkbM family methyltransferase